MTDDLRQHIADALYDTYGQQNRNRSLAIADAAMTVVQPELDRLRKGMQLWCDAVASSEKLRQRQAADADRHEQQLREERDQAVAALDRVRSIHNRGRHTNTCNDCGQPWPCEVTRAIEETQ